MAEPYAIGIDLGGTRIKIVAASSEGRELGKIHGDFSPDEALDWARRIRLLVAGLEKDRGSSASWIGVSAPGLPAADQRSIAHMPGRLHGLEGLDWSRFLETPRPVPVLNDAQAALLGESWIGAARGLRNVILLTLGTGVGGAAMVDGCLLRGEIGRAGHLGHICLDADGPPDVCGTPGSLELAMGNCTIAERTRGRFRTTHDLIAAQRAGDPEADQIWRASVKALAGAICSFINILDPKAVIIGGGIARAGPALFGPLEEFLDKMEWRPGGHQVELRPAQLGEFAGAFGAARQAMGL